MAIQLRRGAYADFDPQKMKPAEVAVVQSDDPSSADGKAVYVAISPGDVKRMAVLDELQDEVYNQIDTAISTATQATVGNAEAWAVGNRGGSAVPSTDPAYHNNSKYYAEQAAESARTLTIDSTLTQSGQAADAKVVGDKIGDLKSAITDANLYKSYNFSVANKGVVYPGGSISGSSDDYITEYIPCKEGQGVQLHGRSFIWNSAPARYLVAFYDSNKSFISGIATIGSESSNTEGTVNVKAPHGTAYVIGGTHGLSNDYYLHIYYDFVSLIDETNGRISETDDIINKAKLYTSISFSVANKGVVYPGGAISGSSGDYITDYTPCVPGQYVEIKGRSFIWEGAPVRYLIAFFDENKSFISGEPLIDAETSHTVGIKGAYAPDGCAYVVGCSHGLGTDFYLRIYAKEENLKPVLSNLIVCPPLSNGSGGNPANANAVTARAIPFNNANYIKFKNTHPIAATGNHFSYVVCAFSGNTWLGNVNAQRTENEFWISPDELSFASNADGFGVTIWEYDSNGDLVSLRSTDFSQYEVTVYYGFYPDRLQDTIITRNNDIRPIIDASCYYGHAVNGSWNANKQFQILVTTDVHGDAKRFNSAISYLNAIQPIDAGICLGDMAAIDWTSPYQWYINAVNMANKPWITVIGNHDGGNSASISKSASIPQEFARWIEPTLQKIGDTSIDKTYYAVKNTTHKIEIIVLNCHDVPDTKDVNTGDFHVSRTAIGYSQDQITWLLSELNSVPSDYTVLIALHYLPNDIAIDSGVWTNPRANAPISAHNCYKGMIPDIVNAWINALSINKSYKSASSEGSVDAFMPTINVIANFSTRGTGMFAGYLAGHVHKDLVGYAVYQDDGQEHSYQPVQRYFAFDTTANDAYQSGNSDLPRTRGTKEEDCITAVTVDTSTRTVRLVRIGSNFTMEMTEREYFVTTY